MIGIIWKKELTEIFRTPGISWLFAGIIFIMGLSLYSGTRYALGHSEMLQQSQERTYQQFISQGYKNPHLGAHFGFYAYKQRPTWPFWIMELKNIPETLFTSSRISKEWYVLRK